MFFVNQYKENDFGLGDLYVRIVVTDRLDQLLMTDSELGITSADYTDIINVSAVKKDMSGDGDKFAVDETGFSIIEASCVTDKDKQCLAFCLEASNAEAARYLGIFVISGSDTALPMIDNADFVGKISDQIRGKEISWMKTGGLEPRDDYSNSYVPTRELDFTVQSIDVTLLESCTHSGKIYDKNGMKISNIYERWAENNWEDAKAIFETRTYTLTDTIEGSNGHVLRFAPLGNLALVIDQFLAYSSEIVTAKNTMPVEFRLKAETELGIETSPFGVEFQEVTDGVFIGGDANSVNNLVFAKDKRLKLKLSRSNGDGQTWSAVFIHRDMLTPRYANEAIKTNTGNDYEDPARNASQRISIEALEHTSEFLFSIARSFGLYIKTNQFVESNKMIIEFEFVPKSEVAETDITELLDATESSFDVSSIILSDANNYYGQGTIFTEDGKKDDVLDKYDFISWTTADDANRSSAADVKTSEKYDRAKKYRDNQQETKSIETKKLLFTTAPTLCSFKHVYRDNSINATRIRYNQCLLNLLGEANEERETLVNTVFGYYAGQYSGSSFTELLHTSVYIHVYPFTEQSISRSGATHSTWCPASTIYSKIDGEEQEFMCLSDYINKISSRDVHFYKDERSLTVPFFGGFRKNGNYGWKILRLGSKIRITNNMLVFNSTSGNWENQDVTKEYAVIGAERNYADWKIGIKLQNISKFNYGYWSGSSSAGRVSVQLNPNLMTQDYAQDVKMFQLGEDISSGTPVMVESDGKVKKLVCLNTNREKQVGILIESGTTGDYRAVQFGGVVYFPNANFALNSRVWARSRDGVEPVSQNCLIYKGYGYYINQAHEIEDMLVELGRPIDPNRIMMSVKTLCYEASMLNYSGGNE